MNIQSRAKERLFKAKQVKSYSQDSLTNIIYHSTAQPLPKIGQKLEFNKHNNGK